MQLWNSRFTTFVLVNVNMTDASILGLIVSERGHFGAKTRLNVMFPLPKSLVGKILKRKKKRVGHLKPNVVLRVHTSVWLLCRDFHAGLWPSQGFLSGDHVEFSMTHLHYSENHIYSIRKDFMVVDGALLLGKGLQPSSLKEQYRSISHKPYTYIYI